MHLNTLLFFFILFIEAVLCDCPKSEHRIGILLVTQFNYSSSIDEERFFIKNKINEYINNSLDENFSSNYCIDIDFIPINDYNDKVEKFLKNEEERERYKYDIYMLDDRLVNEFTQYLSPLDGISDETYMSFINSNSDSNSNTNDSGPHSLGACVKYSLSLETLVLKCLPFTNDYGVLYYRKNRFDDDRIHKFEKFPGIIKDAISGTTFYGYGGQFQGQSFLYNFLEFVNVNDNIKERKDSIVGKNMEYGFHNIRDFYKANIINDTIINMSNEDILDHFLKDELVVFRGWYSTRKIIEDSLKSSNETFNDVFDFSHLPSNVGARGHSIAIIYYYLGISKQSKYKYMSKIIIEYLVSEDFQKEYFDKYFHVSPFEKLRKEHYNNNYGYYESNIYNYINDCSVTTNFTYRDEDRKNDTVIQIINKKPLSWISVSNSLGNSLGKFFNIINIKDEKKFESETRKLVVEIHEDFGRVYEDDVNELKFELSKIYKINKKYYLQFPVLLTTLEVIIIVCLLVWLVIKWVKYDFIKILNYHTSFYYIFSIISFVLSVIGYIFLFDPPYKYKCTIRIWLFDLSLNILFLAFIKKFYSVVNHLRSQLAYYNYKSSSLIIISLMFLLELLIKLLLVYLRPHSIGVNYLNYSNPKTSYYYCVMDLDKGFLLILYTFFQILIRTIIIIVIYYLYLFIKKTTTQYYHAKYITRHIICIYVFIVTYYVFISTRFYAIIYFICLYFYYIVLLCRLFLSRKDVMVINNFEMMEYNLQNIGEDNGSDYSGSDLDESDELLSMVSTSSSTSCFSEYNAPTISEKDIISTFVLLSYFSPFAENSIYIPCCITFLEDTKVLVIEPIIKNKIIALVNNTIRSENITMLNYDPNKEYNQEDDIYYTQKDFRYIFSLNNFVFIINNDLACHRMIQLNEKYDDEFELKELDGEINKDNNNPNFRSNNSDNTLINSYQKRVNKSLKYKNNYIPTIIRFNISTNGVKYKKWYNILSNNMQSRVSSNIDIPVDMQKEFFSSHMKFNNNYNDPTNNMDNIPNQTNNQNKDNITEDHLHPRSAIIKKNDVPNSPYSSHCDANSPTDYDPLIKNCSPFGYDKYQDVHISMNEDDRNNIMDQLPSTQVVVKPPALNFISKESTIVHVKSIDQNHKLNASPSLSAVSTSNVINVNNDSDRSSSISHRDSLRNEGLRKCGDCNEMMEKNVYPPLSKFAIQDNSQNHAIYSNIGGQVRDNHISLNSGLTVSYYSSHDGMDPLISVPIEEDVNDNQYDSGHQSHVSDGLTHRRKMVKNDSNSYLYKSDNNNVSEERVNLLFKDKI